LCLQRERGREKFDISLQKLDEDDAIVETAARIDAENAEHFNYASVSDAALVTSQGPDLQNVLRFIVKFS